MSVTSERIKELRKSLKLTQSDLAKIVNSSRSSIAQIETDKYTPSYAMLALLAIHLGTTPEYLAGLTDDSDSYLSFENKMVTNVPIITSDDMDNANIQLSNPLLAHLTNSEVEQVVAYVEFLKSQRDNSETSSN